MAKVVDPKRREPAAIAEVVDLAGLRVLEVGCGDGRLTWLYADRAASVHGIDTKEESIAAARAATPPQLAGRVRFSVASAVELDEPPESYEAAILAWSL